MITGIYSARFLSHNDLVGAGIAILDGAALHGGGFDYLYKGKYRFADNNRVIATIDVDNYTGKPNSALGLLRSYRLTLSGVAAPQGFTLSGQVEGQPKLIVSLELTKIGELIDQ
jgi:T3SS negative regulator,GrlR